MKCRLCGSDDLFLYYTQGNKGQFKFYKCNNCSLVNYDVSAGLSQEKYGDYYIDPFDEKHRSNKGQLNTFNFIKKQITKKGSAFEIGCGNGKLLYLLKKDGWKTKGLDLSSFAVTNIRNILGIEVFCQNIFDYEDDNKYDLVILRHVLEHLIDPIRIMNKINKMLKDEGFALLEFPNIEGWDLKAKRFLEKFGLAKRKYSDNYLPGHCNEYCKKSFEYLAKIAGFRVLYYETYSQNPLKNLIYKNFNIGNKARTLIKKANIC